MIRITAAGALALAIVCLIPRSPAMAQTPPALQNDMIVIRYNQPFNAKYKPMPTPINTTARTGMSHMGNFVG